MIKDRYFKMVGAPIITEGEAYFQIEYQEDGSEQVNRFTFTKDISKKFKDMYLCHLVEMTEEPFEIRFPIIDEKAIITVGEEFCTIGHIVLTDKNVAKITYAIDKVEGRLGNGKK